ncbi:MAG: hypothetical protein M1823_002907 [Watsoniomyces obsoletus]|nr:MAG: hypothetical protein M1823_002907 [Watsoniomyces obsoletus]
MAALVEPDGVDPDVDVRRSATGSGSGSDSVSASVSSDESSTPDAHHPGEPMDGEGEADDDMAYTPLSTVDAMTPMTGLNSYSSWAVRDGVSLRSASMVSSAHSAHSNGALEHSSTEMPFKSTVTRPQRPGGPARTPSHTYAPPRGPPQYAPPPAGLDRSVSTTRLRRDPNAQYRAQEKAYVQRIRQGPNANNYFVPSDVFPYGPGSDAGDESPASEKFYDGTAAAATDMDVASFYGHDEIQPSLEELKIPANRERLEWHSMLASVLTGDVFKQEKKRLTGTGEQQGEHSRRTELWMGVRAKLCGRTLAAQRRVVEDGRAGLDPVVESIVHFAIKGEKEAGKPPAKQVADVVARLERCESLYPTRQALEADKPRAASDAYRASADAVIAWHSITELINTQLGVLQRWVGNPELDFDRTGRRPVDVADEAATANGGGMETGLDPLSEDASFLDRILREDGLRSLQGEHSMLRGPSRVITKAKETLIAHAGAFAARHLPPYIEELLTLLSFPSRLIEEVIRIRLTYAQRMTDPARQGPLIVEQMIAQFRILLKLAVQIKQEYTAVSRPEPGWELPPCIDEDFDGVVLDALRFYFHMLNWKLSGNKNTFKEAEILESEWDFSNDIGRFLEGGDVEVAEQFSSLTSKALSRLASHFERELRRRPHEPAKDMDRRIKQNLDSVRVRQRKLFRFSRLLSQRFENATEYAVEPDQLEPLFDALIESGHVLIRTPTVDLDGVFLIASPSLLDRPEEIQPILGTCYHAEDAVEDPASPYVLLIRPDVGAAPHWDGRRMEVDLRQPPIDLRGGRVRLVADGSQSRLASARLAFTQTTGVSLDVVVEQRANLPRVLAELMRIKKTTYRLSNTIMNSVEMIRRQTVGLNSQELIQTCFAFAAEFGQRSLLFLDPDQRWMNHLKLTQLALDWVSFICDDCDAADRKTFRWAVVALEFATVMTRGHNILSMADDEYARLRVKVAGCMSLLVSHFDIMGARSSLAAQMERQRLESAPGSLRKMDSSRLLGDEESAAYVREQRLAQLGEIDAIRKQKDTERQPLGRVLEDSSEADRSLAYLSSAATNVTRRWQQGQFIGGGTFGSVYAAINLDSGHLMAVKEIRLHDPQMIPAIAQQIRDEMEVLEVLDHPNVVSYHGIEVHRDKVYIFMEHCSGGSLSNLLEHGRIEDETVTMVYALQMLEGLAYLHASGIVHRDIKPDNILLDHQGVIKFVDFGAAKIIARQGRTTAGPVLTNPTSSGGRNNQHADMKPARPGEAASLTGTPMYMSPERIKGDRDGREGAVDIWSLGCVILEMASGRRPWSNLDNEWAIMYNIAQGNSPPLPSQEELSDLGRDFLRRCFIRDPEQRSTAAELLQHEWIMIIKEQVVLDTGTPSDTSSLSTSTSSYRA